MMKKIILGAFLASTLSYAQIGINTVNPASTLDVTAKNATGTSANVDGLLVPRVDRQRAQSMKSVPVSTLIYVNSVATGTQAGTAVNIDAVGHYYFNGTAWVKLNAGSAPASNVNIYNSNGTLTENRTVNQAGRSLAFNNTITNGFSVSGNTLSVDGANKRIGIGNSAPKTDLQIGDGVTGVTPTIRIAANGNAYESGGAMQFLENNQQWGTIIRHHTGDAAGGTRREGLYFNALANGTESTDPIMMVDQVNARVGIGTAAPKAKLDVQGNMVLGIANSTGGGTGFSTVVRNDATGELQVVRANNNNFAFNYVTYQLDNVSYDWVNDFNTNISTNQYTVIVVGQFFSGKRLKDQGGSSDYNPLNVFAFQSGGTWHLKADYEGGITSDNSNGNWTIYCLVINNSVIKNAGTVHVNLGGSNSGSAGAPAGL